MNTQCKTVVALAIICIYLLCSAAIAPCAGSDYSTKAEESKEIFTFLDEVPITDEAAGTDDRQIEQEIQDVAETGTDA